MSACESPIPYETLVELWAGGLSADAADRVEDHLFGCAVCSQVSDGLGRLIGGLRDAIPPVISQAHRDRLVRSGTRITQTEVDPGTPVDVRYAPELDLLVHVLRADLARAHRVDVEMRDERTDARLELLLDVPFDRTRGEVIIACQRHYEAMFATDPVFQLHVHEPGAERAAGPYVIRHIWR